jgi:transmembrane sensor
MEMSSSRLTMLFSNYYSGLATEAETDELMILIRRSGDDEVLAELVRNAWESLRPDEKEFSEDESEKMFQAILLKAEQKEVEDYPDEKVRMFGWLRYAAASVIFIAGLAVYFFGKETGKSNELATTEQYQITDIMPGGNRALLSLADGRHISLDSTVMGKFGKNGAAEFTGNDEDKLNVIMPNADVVSNPQVNILTTPRGGQYHITLEDGSKVWLNASSSIRFPTVFSKLDRIVEISGEVYFEVMKDSKRPFKVRFGTSEVEVLGTSFNIMAYDEENITKTTLVEGSVTLRDGSKSKTLKPGEQGMVTAGGDIQKADVDLEREIAWKNGLFYFRDSGIEEVMRQTARWYNVEVIYKGKVPLRQFTGKVSRNVNISELLNMLRYAGVNCEISGKKVVVSM